MLSLRQKDFTSALVVPQNVNEMAIYFKIFSRWYSIFLYVIKVFKNHLFIHVLDHNLNHFIRNYEPTLSFVFSLMTLIFKFIIQL